MSKSDEENQNNISKNVLEIQYMNNTEQDDENSNRNIYIKDNTKQKNQNTKQNCIDITNKEDNINEIKMIKQHRLLKITQEKMGTDNNPNYGNWIKTKEHEEKQYDT
jgi:hypothetical protein